MSVVDAPKCKRKLLSNVLTFPTLSITTKVIDKRINSFAGDGLVIMMTYYDLVPQKAID